MPSRFFPAVPLLLLLAAFLSGCGSTPTVRYMVTISDASPAGILVTADWEGVPADSFVLGGFESTEVLRVSELEMLDASGTADRKSTRLNSSHLKLSRMPSSA